MTRQKNNFILFDRKSFTAQSNPQYRARSKVLIFKRAHLIFIQTNMILIMSKHKACNKITHFCQRDMFYSSGSLIGMKYFRTSTRTQTYIHTHLQVFTQLKILPLNKHTICSTIDSCMQNNMSSIVCILKNTYMKLQFHIVCILFGRIVRQNNKI